MAEVQHTSGSIEELLSTSGAEKLDTSTKSDESTLMSHDGGTIIEWGPRDAELYNDRWPLYRILKKKYQRKPLKRAVNGALLNGDTVWPEACYAPPNKKDRQLSQDDSLAVKGSILKQGRSGSIREALKFGSAIDTFDSVDPTTLGAFNKGCTAHTGLSLHAGLFTLVPVTKTVRVGVQPDS
ncbi:hypothetical protein BJV77DRAFT_1104001 [Russula vinacea]|nr:hypothetical protein BJV77DRAFT_1104001 [Russula vinacea]